MPLLVDTSVWSLALRRNKPDPSAEVDRLRAALNEGTAVATTGVVVLELLFGVASDQTAQRIADSLRAVPMIVPTFDDCVAAARTRTRLREKGVQLGPIDALIAQLCITYGHTLLTTDQDFHHAARHVPLRIWGGTG